MNRVKICDLCDVTSSKRVFADEYTDNGIPFYRGKEIIEMGLGNEISNELFISIEKFEEIKRKYGGVSNGDILISAVGTIGIPYLVKNNVDFYFKDGNVVWLKNIKLDKVYPEYIYYILKSPLMTSQINSVLIGTSQKALTIDALKRLEVNLPPLEEQRKIANYLSNLDNQIELNNKINQELEEAAQTLYNYWFVQFEFPNEEGKPYKSSGGKMVWNEELKREIPVGWEVKKLQDMIAETKSGDWGKDKLEGNYKFETNCVRGADIPLILKGTIETLPKRYILNKNAEKLLLEHSFIVEISGGSPTQATGRIAYVNKEILSRNDNKIICSNFCKGFTLKNADYFYFIFQTWKCLYNSGLMFNYEGKTTGIKNFLFDVFTDNVEIAIPNKDIAIKYNLFCEEIFDMIQKNKTQNQELIKLRDYMLPLLMSGQVTIED